MNLTPELFLRDLKVAVRSLGRTKGLAITVVLTLALGIGANAAIFSLVRGVLLRPLVNADENRLIYIRQSAIGIGSENVNFSVPEIQDLKASIHSLTESIAALFEYYEKALHTANALDFDDLLLEAVRLLRHDAPTREAWNRRLSYVMIDEYQDTNRSQYDLMRLLTEQHGNLCVVGDEDQSIYSWRGADIKNILDFERDFPKAHTIRLEQNYRSTKNILAAAGAVVENNKARKGKKLWTESGAGDLLGLYVGHDAENEALFVAD